MLIRISRHVYFLVSIVLFTQVPINYHALLRWKTGRLIMHQTMVLCVFFTIGEDMEGKKNSDYFTCTQHTWETYRTHTIWFNLCGHCTFFTSNLNFTCEIWFEKYISNKHVQMSIKKKPAICCHLFMRMHMRCSMYHSLLSCCCC